MRLVEGDVVELGLGGGDVGDGLAGPVVAPGADGVEVGDQVGRELGGEGLAPELRGTVGEVLEHGELHQQGVARRPRRGLVGEQAELEREVVALRGDGGVDAARVDLEPVLLVGGQGGEGAVGDGAELERALQAVVLSMARPRIAASSPAAWRRSRSICHRRSCAVT